MSKTKFELVVRTLEVSNTAPGSLLPHFLLWGSYTESGT